MIFSTTFDQAHSGGQRSVFQFLRQSILCGALLGTVFPGTAGAAPEGAKGISDPTLAFGLTTVSDYSTQMPFLDLTRTMRPWIGHSAASWDAMMLEELEAGGYVDADGWLTKIPKGLTSVGTVWDWSDSGTNPAAAASRAGTYVLSYEGKGTLELKGDVKLRSSEPGRIVFENLNGGTMELNITTTDRGGNDIRNISVVAEQYEALYEAGQIFNPEWLAVVQDARQLRFMDWMETNNSSVKRWSDRPQVTDVTWAEQGVPVEVMVELANQTGTEPWFNMPAKATDDYIRKFATYVRDHLNPELTVHVEYSNETWNWVFSQTQWMDAQAKALWGEGTNLDYSAMRATQTAVIWDEVFGDQANARVNNVLAVQAANAGVAEDELASAIWAAHDRDGYVDPASVFDSLAIATYFGDSTVSDDRLRAELIAVIQDPTIDANAWLAARLMDPAYPSSIPQVATWWAANKAVADKYGLDLIAYEGGQHVQHSFGLDGLSDADLAILTEFLTGFVRSPAMGDLYAALWEAWAQVSDGPFMQYGDVAEPNKFGSWGLLSALGDRNPRADVLFALNARAESWFGDGGGTQYQQGQ